MSYIATAHSHIFYNPDTHRFDVMDETDSHLESCGSYAEASAYSTAYGKFLTDGDAAPPWHTTIDIANALRTGKTQASIDAAVDRLELLK